MQGRPTRSKGGRSARVNDSELSERTVGGAITALAVRSGRSDRTVVHLEGTPALELATAVVLLAGLRVGQVVSAEALNQLEHEDQPYRARSKALTLLSARDRSSSDIESRLARLGFATDVVTDTVEWLRERGYVDDERFVERYSSEKLRAGWAERRVRGELSRQGLESELVDRVLAGASSDDEAVSGRADALLETLRRRFAAQLVADPKAAERRMAGFLARRGYDWGTVDRVTRRLREEVGVGGGEPVEPDD